MMQLRNSYLSLLNCPETTEYSRPRGGFLRVKSRMLAMLMACFLLHFSIIPTALATKSSIDDGLIVLDCISNVVEDKTIDIYVKNQHAYIKATDAARFSGYTLTGKSANMVSFKRGNDVVSVSLGMVINNEYWTSLEWTMECLHTQIALYHSTLLLTSYGYAIDKLFTLTDQYTSTFAQYKLSEDDHILEVTGFLSSLYNRLTGFKIMESLTGAYDEKKYEDIFREILKLDTSTPLSTLVNTGKDMRYLHSVVKKFGEDFGTLSELLEIFSISTDPLGTLIKEVSTVGISGLSISDQLEIYGGLKGLYLSAEYARNMVRYTFSEDALGYRWHNYLPSSASVVVEDMNDIWDQFDYIDILREEYDAIVKNTAYGTINGFLGGEWISVSAKLTGKLLDKVIMPQTGKAMDFSEKYMYLATLQEDLSELYGVYRKSNETAINAKYTTILNLRIIQVAYELSVAEGGIDDVYQLPHQIDEALESLLSISDESLISEQVDNESLDLALLTEGFNTKQNDGTYDTLYAAFKQLYDEHPDWYTNFAICDIDLDQEPEILAAYLDHHGWECDVYNLSGDWLEYFITLTFQTLELREMNDGTINWYHVAESIGQGYIMQYIERIELLSDGRCFSTVICDKGWQGDVASPVYSYRSNGKTISKMEYNRILSNYENSIVLQTVVLHDYECPHDWSAALLNYMESLP